MQDAASFVTDAGFRVIPLQAGGKIPLIGDWATNAVEDPGEVVAMWQRYKNSNVGIPTGSVNDIAVVDIDSDDAKEWWDTQGVPAGLEVRTPSGGWHLYYATDPEMDIQTNKSKIYPGIDVRAEGGQVVAPGSRTPKGVYTPVGEFSRAAVPPAPPELLELLPRRQKYKHLTAKELKARREDYKYASSGDFDGVAQVTKASHQEEVELEWIARTLDELPRPWHEGAGWRSTVFQVSCWLWRMVRSPYYLISEAEATELLLQHAPSDETWTEQNVIQEWTDADRRTDGQIAEEPEPDNPELLEWNGFPWDAQLPDVDDEAFAVAWGKTPESNADGSLWAHRQKLLTALLKAGRSEQEAATLVWHAKATKLPGISFGEHYIVDSDLRRITIDDLWNEVRKAQRTIAEGNGALSSPAPSDERPALSPQRTRYSFLSNEEREMVEAHDWWGKELISWVSKTMPLANLPYFRMNRWTILSVVFSPWARLPTNSGTDRILNLYQAIVGPTTSGKTEALRIVKNVLKYVFEGSGDTPDVGGNFTPAALTKLLIERDELPSWIHIDEAHTKIAEWKKPVGPTTEMPGVITEVYDGEVSAIYRTGDKENSGKHATAYATVHLMGTPEGMNDAMGPEDWESGFLNRFIWTIGDPPRIDAKVAVSGWVTEDEVDQFVGGESPAVKMYRQWGAQLNAAVNRVRHGLQEGQYARMRLPQEVLDRHQQFVAQTHEIIDSKPAYEQRLRPTFHRFQETIMRVAALVALSERSLRVEPIHHLIALEQAEEWMEAMLHQIAATDESLRTRHVNIIEQEIMKRGEKGMEQAAIHRLPRFRNESRYVQGLLAELLAQGRVSKSDMGDRAFYKIKGA